MDGPADNAAAHLARGLALRAEGKVAAAVESLAVAVALRPDLAAGFAALGEAQLMLGRAPEAEASLRTALALAPDDRAARIQHGNALWTLGRRAEALAVFADAADRAPDDPNPRTHLAMAQYNHGDLDAAEATLRAVLTRHPSHAEAHAQLGRVMLTARRHDAAGPPLEAALALRPDDIQTRMNLCYLRLLTGDYAAGWPLYEGRWRLAPGLSRHKPAAEKLPLDRLAGRTVLLFGEQGLGDTLHFVRYAPLVAARGARVLLEVPAPLVRLLAGMPGVAAVFPTGAALPPFDHHAALMSLPWAFGTTLATIPATMPYIPTPSAPKLRRDGRRLVGLAWAGSPAQAENRFRSMPLAALRPLLDLPGHRFVSLQQQVPEADAALLAGLPGLEDLRAGLGDFHDTAGIVGQLDLVLTVDTSLAHLAGALARPTWIMLWTRACWRYLLDREDSPWYPTARLFRQSALGDWDGVVARVGAALRQAG